MTLADVVLPLPLADTYTYRLPDNLVGLAAIGSCVRVPLGTKKTYAAIVVRLHEETEADIAAKGYTLKDVIALLSPTPVALPRQLQLWQWIADYYLCTLGDVYKAAVPSGERKKTPPQPSPAGEGDSKSLFSLTNSDTNNPSFPLTSGDTNNLSPSPAGEGWGGVLPLLSPAQQRAKEEIEASWQTHPTTLLHGVTSSGKTEIYIHLIAEAITQGRQVLFMLPEIVLTAQLVERLQRVFGDRLGVYHSKYTEAQRARVWQRQLSTQPYDIIVGVRSSVFLPYQRLGLVIVDEEHETSFKQQEPAPRYHARNVALVLAQMFQAKTLLGTATPSIESYFNATPPLPSPRGEGDRNIPSPPANSNTICNTPSPCGEGRGGLKYALVELTERYGQLQLPQIETVNVAELRRKKLMHGLFSPRLIEAMREALAQREQVILFLNRRGYAPQLECHTCGWTPRCTQCDVSLTYHQRTRALTCHYCGAVYPLPVRCPNCEDRELRSIGYGTERVETTIQEFFPEARIARMDLDTTRSRTAYEELIARFAAGETDILVGTQMVTKGLDFERVSVVGILNADAMLHMPDFRSYERTFQMLTQVAGRAGRHNSRGRVILQTKDPANEVIQQIIGNDYKSLFRSQLEERREFHYPPYCRLIDVYLKHRDPHLADALAADMAALLRRVFGDRVLGPDVPFVSRVKLMYIRKLALKIETTASMAEARHRLLTIQRHLLSLPHYKSAQVYYDVDPM